MGVVRSRRRYGRWFLGGLVACGGLAGAVSYARADTAERRRAKVGAQGVVRFLRSISVGLIISLDYWWAGRGLDEVRHSVIWSSSWYAVSGCMRWGYKSDIAFTTSFQKVWLVGQGQVVV